MILNAQNFSTQPSHLAPNDQSLFIAFRDHQLLLQQKNGQFNLVLWLDIKPHLHAGFKPFELAHSGNSMVLCPPFHEVIDLAEDTGFVFCDLNIFRQMNDSDAALVQSALHLWTWYKKNQFCGCCASPMLPDHTERMLKCTQCENMLFPQISPAVIVAITCGDKILLARNAHGNFKHYALIAGYVEVGETLEQTLRREVLEEVGITLQTAKYLGNQPWGISGSMMFGFHATADDTQPLKIQHSELSDAKWFNRSELEPRAHSQSIAFELIERFRKGEL